jgi:hypothetical protein
VIRNPVKTVTNIVYIEGGMGFVKNLKNKIISYKVDVRLAKAYDEIVFGESEREKRLVLQDFEELKKTRQDIFVRWTMDRHVHSVKRIMPSTSPCRDNREFIITDEHGKDRLQWGEYIRHVCCYFVANIHPYNTLPAASSKALEAVSAMRATNDYQLFFYYSELYGDRYIGASSELASATKDVVSSSVERLLLTSVPWQRALMKIRQIYRWEDPLKTAVCLVLYVYLWALSYITAVAVSTHHQYRDHLETW